MIAKTAAGTLAATQDSAVRTGKTKFETLNGK